MKITIDVTMTEGENPIRVIASNPDANRWEMYRMKNGMTGHKPEDFAFTFQTFMAWSAMNRQRLTDLDFKTFQHTCLEVEAIGAVEMADPTQLDRGNEP